MRSTFLFSLALFCFFFIGCNKKTTVAETNNNTTPIKGATSIKENNEQLKGVWWVVNFPYEGKPFAPAQFYKIEIAEQSMGIMLSINSCGIPYERFKDGVLKITGNNYCTEACCDNKESLALFALFKGELKYTISENLLSISTPTGDIKLTKSADLLQGTKWTAVSYADRKEGVHVKLGNPYILSFEKTTVGLQLNANKCSTPCTYIDKDATFELPTNSMGCTRNCCDYEDALLLMNSLQGKITYKKEKQNLILTTYNKELIFVPYIDSSQD